MSCGPQVAIMSDKAEVVWFTHSRMSLYDDGRGGPSAASSSSLRKSSFGGGHTVIGDVAVANVVVSKCFMF